SRSFIGAQCTRVYTLSLHDALPILSHCLIIEDHLWSKEYLITVDKYMPINPLALIDNAVQTFGIFDQPGSILPTDSGMETRDARSEEHTSELQSLRHLVCRLLLEKK